jgi:2-polyprenyl-3-methyl-5-hydroxy-6-metoxy-1,4-benzoquinol methylase
MPAIALILYKLAKSHHINSCRLHLREKPESKAFIGSMSGAKELAPRSFDNFQRAEKEWVECELDGTCFRLKQDPKAGIPGVLYDCSFVLAYFCQKKLQLRDKNVVELGCGCGLVGLAVAKLGCKKALLTDRSAEAVALVNENIEANELEVIANASCFSFGDEVLLLGEDPQFDFILCSDVIYDIKAVPPLIETLHVLLKREKSTAYIAFKKRNKQRETILLRGLSENFDVTSETYDIPACLGETKAEFVILRVEKEVQSESILLLTNFEENEPCTKPPQAGAAGASGQ